MNQREVKVPTRFLQEVSQAVTAIRSRFPQRVKTAIILGSGLGGLADRFESASAIPYSELPHWSRSTCAGHRGRLVIGMLDGVWVVALDGRLHRYEGWSATQITFPVHVLAALGVETLVVSNAAGGVSSRFKVGDIMLLEDHIDLQWGLLQNRKLHEAESIPNEVGIMRRASPYDPELIEIAMNTARKENFACYRGVYLATLGPNYETRAEYRMMRRLGADVVGMSTVPEVLAAQRLGMRVLAMSMISNVACPDKPVKADHDEVLQAGEQTERKMTLIVRAVVGCGKPNYLEKNANLSQKTETHC